MVFFTGESYNQNYLADFKANATVIQLAPFVYRKNILRKLLINALIKKVNAQAKVTFSSNARFYYELLPLFKRDIKKVDLVHAFVHEGEEGAEYFSLPVVHLLNERIVINNKTKADFKALYAKYGVEESLNSRIRCIYNKTDFPAAKPVKDISGTLKVLYVGRDTFEKRVHLYAKVVEHFAGNSKLEFWAIGEGLSKFFTDCSNKALHLTGAIQNEEQLAGIYAASHILLLFSSREGLPMVIMEAQAHGMVCITTAVGGIAEIIADAENGFLINPAQTEEEIVADFIEKLTLLMQTPARIETMGSKAFADAQNKFTAHHFVEGYREVFNL
ncbi:MAG: glycosyltransferase [Chitinophagales bacterium]